MTTTDGIRECPVCRLPCHVREGIWPEHGCTAA